MTRTGLSLPCSFWCFILLKEHKKNLLFLQNIQIQIYFECISIKYEKSEMLRKVPGKCV
jgi:hypothetical protein